MERLLTDLQQHSLSWAFLQPVNAAEVSDYYEVIKEPMGAHPPQTFTSIHDLAHDPGLDFSTMEQKLRTGKYENLDAFVEDAQLVFDNCRIYNPDGTIYARNATKMEKYMRDQLTMYRVKREEN
jgi:histone acetyltransferase